MNDKTELQRDVSTEKSPSTIPPDILSHYVPGDTPTLYASSRPNSSSHTLEHPPQGGGPGSTSFTFFGVPIPPLNFNNVWGKNKGTGKRQKDGRRNSLPKKTSTVDQDGFTPMLPGTGGFRPVMSTPDHSFFGEEIDNEEEHDTMYKNKSTPLRVMDTSRYHFGSTTESPFYYDKYPGNEYSFSKFVNITTRDSLYESATINSIVRSTAKPSTSNNQQQTAASDAIIQSDDSINQSENLSKSSTGNIKSLNRMYINCNCKISH